MQRIRPPSDRAWFIRQWRHCIPHRLPPVLEWAKEHIKLPGGERGRSFDPERTPWTKYPIECADNPSIRSITFVKPIQTGGTIAGMVTICRKILSSVGKIQYNWSNDSRAMEQWDKDIEARLKACPPVKQAWPSLTLEERYKAKKCLVIFPNVSLTVQGVFVPNNLDSDSVGVIINEEIHSWEPGMLQKARGRQTAVSFPLMFNISNAGFKEDQLDEAWQAGTQQEYEVLCPGCAKYHVMRTGWDPKHPERGGLWYDRDKCRRDNGTYDYNKLLPTLVYKMPCGHIVHNDIEQRRALSASGRYSEPFNTGALASDVSLRYQAVVCHDIDWLQLVKEKHAALRALRNGNEEPWRIYKQERECEFYSADSRPYQGQVVLNPALVKSREGLKDRAARLWAADKQRGYRAMGQLSHYWLVIRDVMENCDSRLVFEGLVQTDTELISTLDTHNCPRFAGVVDASWDTKAVMEMCYRNGLNAVMANVSHRGLFLHSDKVRRFYAEEKAIHTELNMPPRFNYVQAVNGWAPAREEPMVIFYNKAGLLRNLFFIREHKTAVQANNPKAQRWEWIEHEVPADVSEDYKLQTESWERVSMKQARTNDDVEGFEKKRKDDHLLMCEGYVAMLMDIGGYLGQRLAGLGVAPQ